MKAFVLAITLLAMAAAQDYTGRAGQQGAGQGPEVVAYSQPGYNYAPRPYNFAYEVKDPQSYNDYGHQESSDGKTVTGSYRVALPDGRLQLVNYKADGYGYVADVQYQGEAKYPEYRPQQYAAPAGSAYSASVGPGPIQVPVRAPVAVSGQGPVRVGYVPANAGVVGQKY